MSYSRFSEGDVYVFLSNSGYLECCGCILQKSEWVEDPNSILKGYLKPVPPLVVHEFEDTQSLLDHLDIHIDQGHDVPVDCIKALKEDAEENDRWIRDFHA